MAGKTQSRKRRGKRSSCSYCNGNHKGGPKGNSCGGHSVKAMTEEHKKPPTEMSSDWTFERERKPNMNSDAVRRRERAILRGQARKMRSPQQQLDVLAARGFTNGKEVDRLLWAIQEQHKKAETTKKEVSA